MRMKDYLIRKISYKKQEDWMWNAFYFIFESWLLQPENDAEKLVMAKWVSSKIEFVENHSELKNRNERAREKYVHNNVV